MSLRLGTQQDSKQYFAFMRLKRTSRVTVVGMKKKKKTPTLEVWKRYKPSYICQNIRQHWNGVRKKFSLWEGYSITAHIRVCCTLPLEYQVVATVKDRLLDKKDHRSVMEIPMFLNLNPKISSSFPSSQRRPQRPSFLRIVPGSFSLLKVGNYRTLTSRIHHCKTPLYSTATAKHPLLKGKLKVDGPKIYWK